MRGRNYTDSNIINHLCRLHYPIKDLVKRLASEILTPIRYAAMSETDYVLLRAIIALNPGATLVL